jgi:predicted amidohydrolase YtcJ
MDGTDPTGTGIGASISAMALVLLAPALTMDDGPWRAEAVAISGERIAAVGTAAHVRDVAGPRPEVIHLPDGLVLPGFQDAHVHPTLGGLERLRCDLHAASDRRGYRDLIARFAHAHPDAPWIQGGGWSMAAFPGGTPRSQDLDDLLPDRPAFLTNRDGHGAWVNSRALALAGVDRRSPDPPDGRVERDPDTGEPTGTLHEGAMDLVERLIPPPTLEEWMAAIVEAQTYLQSLGITAWQDAIVEPEHLEAYRSLAGRGDLTARVVAALWWERDRGVEQIDELAERRSAAGGDGIDAGTVKIMLDGVIENFTASMTEPYLDAAGKPTANRGLRFVEPELLADAVTRLDARGFQVHFHAIGDRAVRDALDAVEAASVANGRHDRRHHIAHLQVVHPDDISRFAELDVTANAQALWACHEPQMDELTIPFLGPERTVRQYPFRSLVVAGTRLAMGSDWSVSSPNPLLQIEVAVTRTDPEHRENRPFLPDERLGAETAVTAFTRGSSHVNRLDGETGTIAPGRLADLVVLDRDPFEEGAIGDARVLLTMVGGRVVHQDGLR